MAFLTHLAYVDGNFTSDFQAVWRFLIYSVQRIINFMLASNVLSFVVHMFVLFFFIFLFKKYFIDKQ